MKPSRWYGLVASLAICSLVVACGPKGLHVQGRDVAADPDSQVGFYKVRLGAEAERTRSFRMWLFAEGPDRFHAEVVTPVGGTALVLDGNADCLSVHFIRDDVVYVGPPNGSSLASLLGLRVLPEELVSAVLTGRAPGDDLGLIREPDATGLPEYLELRDGDRWIQLQRRRLQPLRVDAATLGLCAVPADAERRALADLAQTEVPGVEVEGEAP